MYMYFSNMPEVYMKKTVSALIIAVLISVVPIFSFAEYNREKVVQVMRDNVRLMGEASKAAKSENYVKAAEALMELVQGMIEIKDYTAPRGSQTDWNATNDLFIRTAFQGIGACGNEDKDALNSALKELQRLGSQGHRNHR